MAEVVSFLLWVCACLLILLLGVRITVQIPDWWGIFGHPFVGVISLLGIPTLFLTLYAWHWFVERDA